MKIAIIGAGWFGCHLALQLKKRNIDVVVFEQGADVFAASSGHNTGKLHQGFHYPRSKSTRLQAKSNFNRFISTYPDMVLNTKSIYAIADEQSLLDFATYKDILDGSGLSYEEIDEKKVKLNHIEGAVLTPEKNIHTGIAKDFFRKHLKGHIRFNFRVNEINSSNEGVSIDGNHYDYCINTSNNRFSPFLKSKTVYEQIVIPLYKAKNPTLKNMSYVIMDGPFISINPYFKDNEDLISTYDVVHSVLTTSSEYSEVKHLSEVDIQKAIEKIEDKIMHYYPSFKEETIYDGYALSNRTKSNKSTANRECFVKKAGNVIHVFSGKISSIFTVEERVFKLIEAVTV